MVTFGTITEKTVRAPYKKEDYEGFNVEGTATYNKDNKLTDAFGNITDAETGERIANFNIYGEGERSRVNLSDCIVGRMNEAVAVAEATLTDLAEAYPY